MVYQTTGYEQILYDKVAQLIGISPEKAVLLITGVVFVVFIWKLIWYSIAIYKTIERKQKIWFSVLFVCAFVLGDLGILAIIYLIIYRDKEKSKKTEVTLDNFVENVKSEKKIKKKVKGKSLNR
jgi:hypothetical protein